MPITTSFSGICYDFLLVEIKTSTVHISLSFVVYFMIFYWSNDNSDCPSQHAFLVFVMIYYWSNKTTNLKNGLSFVVNVIMILVNDNSHCP